MLTMPTPTILIMTKLVKNTLDAILLLLGVSVVVFSLLYLTPGNALLIQVGVGSDRVLTESYQALFSLNTSPFIQYFEWLQGLLRGDFGVSYVYHAPVFTIVLHALGVTAVIASVAMVIAVSVSLPLGLYLGSNGSQVLRTPLTTAVTLGVAVPQFLWGILLLYLFGNVFSAFVPGLYVPLSSILPMAAAGSGSHNTIPALAYLFAPALALALPAIAILSRYTYNSVRELNAQPFMLALHCRGIGGWQLLRRHTLRNLLVGYTTFSGILLIDLLAGSVLVEYIFNIPGLGNTLVTGIHQRDTLLVQGAVLYVAFLVVVINKITDGLYYILNPKLRRS